MTYNTCDQFQGIWLGSIFGQALIDRTDRGNRLTFDFSSPDWLKQRKQATAILLEAEGLADSRQNKFQCGRNLLSILPWILIYGEDRDSLKLTINKLYRTILPSEAREDTIEDIFLWSHLLRLLLNTSRSPLDFKLWCRQAIENAEVSNLLLINKLTTATAAVRDGMSLQQLSEKLDFEDNSRQTAIALAYYCFVTTPEEFSLSVTRAANIPYLAWLTAPLTATLSGAYNGMTGIPKNWRAIAERHSDYHLEIELAIKLFRAWLGVYPADCEELRDREFHAVAVPQLIQPRKSLKIISQTKFLFE